ncbi:MAG: VanW family protein [Clostridia bacterium]|jgi:vancomycin resistance protein YoaR|nr:VanW family protein [Clostridia bacterium]
MKKYILPIIILIAFIVLIAYFYFNKFNFKDEIDYTANRTGIELENNSILDNDISSKPIITEEEISSFSTKIIDDDDNRDTNIRITCNEINGTIVKNGEEFSFNESAGNPTPDRGYKKAGVFIDGELKKGYGGGNCQVSTTIYNAVNKIDGIKVTERHEHGKEVGYIEMGKDSTVVYDGLDLKFENNTGYDIKLYAELSDKKIKVKVNKLK